MSYLNDLLPVQLSNIYTVIDTMKRKGITNKYMQAAILAVISKESSFKGGRETGYSNTSNQRIRSVFSKTSSLNDNDLNRLKSNDVDFFNFVYGGMYGNSSTEGYKYRGGGFNQLTFKGNYISESQRTGHDLVNNPDLISQPNVAADVVVDYYIREFAKVGKDLNKYNDLSYALVDAFQANRGWGKTGPDTTGGFAKAQANINDFYTLVGNDVKKKL